MADSKNYSPILCKNLSWSPEIQRRTEWRRLKLQQRRRLHRSQSFDSANSQSENITDDDIKELTACFDLGFGFDTSNDMDPKLTQAFPALELYAAVNRNLSRTSSTSSDSSSSSNTSSSLIVDPSDDPEKVKMRIRRWAQVVACSIHAASIQPKTEVEECTS